MNVYKEKAVLNQTSLSKKNVEAEGVLGKPT
jgi:hypothetical protein